MSYGNFGDNYQFETVHTWSYVNELIPGSLAYLSDARPPRFRVCLSFSRGEPLDCEWMDILENTICGLVFEAPNCQSEHQDHQVVYFVVDRPPRFYRGSRANQRDPGPLLTRISHPTSLPRQVSTDVDVCDVPWPIQYCRVLKVEYRMRHRHDFCLRSYEPHISDERKEAMLCFERAPIPGSVRQVDHMVNILRSNLEIIATGTRSCTGCELGLVKLLYNCNLSATSLRSTHILQMLITIHANIDQQGCRLFAEGLSKMSQDMGTVHARALRDLHPSLPSRVEHNDWSVLGWDGVETFFNKYLLGRMEQQQGSNCSPGVFEVKVCPSHIELQGPIDPPVNSVTDEYKNIIDQFIRFKFLEDTSKKLKPETKHGLDTIIDQRVVRVLTHENHPLPQITGLQGFEFLGYSMSSLKKRKAVWFFRAQDQTAGGLNAKQIRDKIGDWDANGTNKALANRPSMWGARISLAFTEAYSVVTLPRVKWHIRDDYGQDPKFPNTDGCGLVSPALCHEINKALGPFGFDTVMNGDHLPVTDSTEADIHYRDPEHSRSALVASRVLSMRAQSRFSSTRIESGKCFCEGRS